MSSDRFFGEVPGVPPGTSFPSRQALHDAGVHMPPEAGISGGATEGADSIVISGGYADDEDYGDYIICTGQGGRDRGSPQIVRDQTFVAGNKALAVSCVAQLPVRVIRGAGGDPAFSPATGFRYDGLFFVERFWEDRVPHLIFRFRLVRADIDASSIRIVPTEGDQPGRREVTQLRIVRNFKLAEQVKRLNDHYCQICGDRIDTPAGPYAEAAHIRPLGRPHDGPDATSNLLCLCPNDHKRLDTGALWIDEQRRVYNTADGMLLGVLPRSNDTPWIQSILNTTACTSRSPRKTVLFALHATTPRPSRHVPRSTTPHRASEDALMAGAGSLNSPNAQFQP